MIVPLTTNTQAILLLTAPLIVGRRDQSVELLTFAEYNKLARLLHEMGVEPADLLGPKAAEILEKCKHVAGVSRLQGLLARGFLLSQAVEKWSARAIWVVSRVDPEYPKRITSRLKEEAP